MLMSAAFAPLPTTLAECHARLREQQGTIDTQQATIEQQQATIDDQQALLHALQRDIALMKRTLFGQRRERFEDPRQGMLFDSAEIDEAKQGDANEAILRCLDYCQSPAFVLNVTGPDIVSIRHLAWEFSQRLGIEPVLEGTEQPTALISNAGRYVNMMGPPSVTLPRMIDWVAHWIRIGGSTLNKPTHYETRDGRF